MERADLEQWKAREVARLLALVETERRYYQEIVASIPVGLLVLSKDLAIVSANRSIRKIFGLRSGDAVRGRLDTMLPGWLLDKVEATLKTGEGETDILVEAGPQLKRRLRVGIQAIRNWDDEASQEALLTIEDLTGSEPLADAAEAVPEQAPEAAHEVAPLPVETHSVQESAITMPESLIAGAPAPAAPVEVPVPIAEPETFPASQLIDNLEAIVWALELPSKHFLFVSPQAETLLGLPTEAWTSNPNFWNDRVYAVDRIWVTQAYQRAIERGEGYACEFRALAANGRVVWLRESARLLTNAEGQPNYLIGVTVDVTERRLLEDQLVQSERVEASSKLASRMAHDLNNMLMILTGYSEELLNGIPADNPLRADVQEILTATERMSELTNQLLAFSRRQTTTPGTTDLEGLLKAAEHRLGADLQLSSEPNRVKADGDQLEQVIASMVDRMRMAMRGEGMVTIETSHVLITEDLRRGDSPMRPGPYAVITITGAGRPIEGDARLGLFETVLSTKDSGEEVAAAVSKAYGIVRQWGGDIAVSSAPEDGTIFDIYLERLDPPVKAVKPEVVEPVVMEPEPPVLEVEAPLETILVVEDEAGIRALVRKILRRQGYEVLEAANGDEAVAICSEQPHKIDLLITDVIMPQMGGRELVKRLHEQNAGMKVLYVSGYTDDVSIYGGSFPPGTSFLQKPFTLGSLLDKVKEVLSAKVN